MCRALRRLLPKISVGWNGDDIQISVVDVIVGTLMELVRR